MNVLCVTHFFGAHGGGIERVAERICRGLAARGISVTWAATEMPGETPAPSPGMTIEPLKGWSGIEARLGYPFPLLSAQGRERLSALVDRSDLLHLHDGIYPAGHAAARRARTAAKPVVITQHIGDIPFRDPVRRSAVRVANRLLTRRLLRRVDSVVFVSRTVQSYFADVVEPHRSSLVFNGVDLDVFSPVGEPREDTRRELGLDPRRPTFLFVGRFVAKKGLWRVRQAARALPEVQWLLAGRGPEHPERWSLPNVRALGHVPEEQLARLYRAADLLVLPSVGEGFPLVVQEAMACGTPCLVSEETRAACPPASDAILTAGPQARDFLGACRRALEPHDRDALRARVAAVARAEWSWDRCVERYRGLFQGLVASQSKERSDLGMVRGRGRTQ